MKLSLLLMVILVINLWLSSNGTLFKKSVIFNKSCSNESVIKRIKTTNHIKCSAECDKYEDCLSVTFSKISFECVLCTVFGLVEDSFSKELIFIKRNDLNNNSKFSQTVDSTRTQTTTTIISSQVYNFNGTLKLNIPVKDDYQRVFPLSNGDLVRGSSGSTIQIWDIQNATIKRNLTSLHFRPYIFGVLSNGDLLAGYLNNKIILIWDLNVTQGDPLKRTIQTNEIFEYLTVLKNDDLVIGQGYPSTNFDIVIRDSQNGQVKRRLVGHTNKVYQILILPNENLVSCSHDATVKIWNTSNSEPLKSITHSTGVWSIAILKNGYLASGLWNGKIEIRYLETGDLIRVLIGHSNAICPYDCLHVLDNGNLLSGSYDMTLKVWNPYNGSVLMAKSHRSDVCQTTFLPNGDLVTASHYEICIWK